MNAFLKQPLQAWLCLVVSIALAQSASRADETNKPSLPNRPLTLEDCLSLALQQNAQVLKSQKDIEATQGVILQTRSIVIPKLRASGDYAARDQSSIETIDVPSIPGLPGNLPVIHPDNEQWAAGVRVTQSIFEGGRMRSALRTARLLRDQALAQYQAVLADTLTEVQVSFYDVLLSGKQIEVNEATVKLLERELEDNKRRFDAGTVPQFNVLRAEVELANAKPNVSRARNAYRLSKNLLANRLGYNVPKDAWEDIPLQIDGSLDAGRFRIDVPTAVARALERRPELVALRKTEGLRKENIVTARAGYLPSVQGYAGYGWRSPQLTRNLTRDFSGWEAGVQLGWDIFDGALTRGRVSEARALKEKAELDTEDTTRRIELEVRSAYSVLVEAWEVLESADKVVEQAAEAQRLAQARADAGTGTQLDVLSATTALSEARTTLIRAKRDYVVARVRLERAIGTVAQLVPAGPEERAMIQK